MVKKFLLGLVALTAGAEAHRLNLRGKSSMKTTVQPGLCGKDYDSLNDGTKEYFDTIKENLWTHPGNQPAFSTFKGELQCWFAKMIDGNCGGLQPNADRKKQLYADCNATNKDCEFFCLSVSFFSLLYL